MPPSTARAVGLLLGTALDALLGDPRRYHPVAGFGAVAGSVERRMWADSRRRGTLFTAAVVGGVVVMGAAAQRFSSSSAILRAGMTAVATWTVLGGRSLRAEAAILQSLVESGDLPAARERVTHLVGRDPSGLGPDEIARAGVESVAENTSDAVVAPLVWGVVAGVPGLLGYRAVNTLDAMVGHRSPRYESFGWASARLDDLANIVPARLCAAITALVSGSPRRVWSVVRRDARRHPSPNAGWCETAYAAALGVRLGGTNSYAGRVEHRPVIGDGRAPVVADLGRAARLTSRVTAVAAGLAGATALALHRRPSRCIDGGGRRWWRPRRRSQPARGR